MTAVWTVRDGALCRVDGARIRHAGKAYGLNAWLVIVPSAKLCRVMLDGYGDPDAAGVCSVLDERWPWWRK